MWALGSGKLNLVEDLVRSQWVDFDVDNCRDHLIAPWSVPNVIRHAVARWDDSSDWSVDVLESGWDGAMINKGEMEWQIYDNVNEKMERDNT